jgi:hypothetical protein
VVSLGGGVGVGVGEGVGVGSDPLLAKTCNSFNHARKLLLLQDVEFILTYLEGVEEKVTVSLPPFPFDSVKTVVQFELSSETWMV